MNKEASKFIITCAPRTGSTMLRMMLNLHPNIICFGEAISIHGKPNLGRKIHKKINKTSDELAEILSRESVNFLYEYIFNQEDCEAVGVKIKYRQLEEQFQEIFDKIANDKTISIVHLTRKNLLKRYVSHKLSGSQKTPHVILNSQKQQEQEQVKVKVNVQNCLEDISSVKKAEIRFREYFKNHKFIEIVYEDILADRNSQMEKIQNFLGVNSIELSPKTVKVNSDNLEDIVENYQELAEAIKETSNAQYLD